MALTQKNFGASEDSKKSSGIFSMPETVPQSETIYRTLGAAMKEN